MQASTAFMVKFGRIRSYKKWQCHYRPLPKKCTEVYDQNLAEIQIKIMKPSSTKTKWTAASLNVKSKSLKKYIKIELLQITEYFCKLTADSINLNRC